jgi:hypothetical protein
MEPGHSEAACFFFFGESCRVYIRFLALAGIYHDFCRMAWEEYSEPEDEYWADELGLTNFRIGQLIGEDAEWDLDGAADEAADEAAEEALQHLIHASRSTVLRVLRDGFGGQNGLFVALWRSNRAASMSADDLQYDDKEHEETVDLTDEEILNDVRPEKMAAYEWLQEECSALSSETECL